MKGIRVKIEHEDLLPSNYWKVSFYADERKRASPNFISNPVIREALTRAGLHRGKIGNVGFDVNVAWQEAIMNSYYPLGHDRVAIPGDVPIQEPLMGKGIANLLEYYAIQSLLRKIPTIRYIQLGWIIRPLRQRQYQRRRIIPKPGKHLDVSVFLEHLRWKIARDAFKSAVKKREIPQHHLKSTARRLLKRRPPHR
ncbi:MAG: hypothetical protein V1776_02590 [Candidatus Diapherotrites archaeon]